MKDNKKHWVNIDNFDACEWQAITPLSAREYWEESKNAGVGVISSFGVRTWAFEEFNSFANETAMAMNEVLDEIV